MRMRYGLTLIELVISITLTGITVSAGYLILAMLVDNHKRAEEQVAGATTAAVERRRIIRWLSGARLSPLGTATFKGEDGIRDKRPADVLTFLTNTPTPVSSSESVIQMYVDRDDSTAESGLTAIISDVDEQSHLVVEVDSSVTGFDVSYLSRVIGNLQWHSSWVSSTVLPAAVKIVLTSDSSDSLHPILSYPIIVPVGVSQ